MQWFYFMVSVTVNRSPLIFLLLKTRRRSTRVPVIAHFVANKDIQVVKAVGAECYAEN
jgi:hypothetical protein